MNPITSELLRALAPAGDWRLIDALAPLLNDGLPAAGIGTPLRQAHFLAQAVYESGYLASPSLSENMNYSAARIPVVFPKLAARADELAHNPEGLANAAYGGRYGNGDEASGDGWRYRGRGLFQLTFKDNYAEFAAGEDPDSVATPGGAVATAVKYWNRRGCNSMADTDDISAVTYAINGGQAGLSERRLLKHDAFRLLEA